MEAVVGQGEQDGGRAGWGGAEGRGLRWEMPLRQRRRRSAGVRPALLPAAGLCSPAGTLRTLGGL